MCSVDTTAVIKKILSLQDETGCWHVQDEKSMKHEVCFSSKEKDQWLHPSIEKIGVPNFYKSDLLEILWLLKRESVRSEALKRSLRSLEAKMNEDQSWSPGRSIKDTVVSLNANRDIRHWTTERAMEVMSFYKD